VYICNNRQNDVKLKKNPFIDERQNKSDKNHIYDEKFHKFKAVLLILEILLNLNLMVEWIL
jgi:hypothetical protein